MVKRERIKKKRQSLEKFLNHSKNVLYVMGKISIVFDTKNSKKTLETSDESEAKSFVIDNIKKADLENVKIEVHKISNPSQAH